MKLVDTAQAGEMIVNEGRIFPSNLSKAMRETVTSLMLELKERRESREDLGAKYPAVLWFYLEEAEFEVCRLWRIVPLILLC